MDTFSSYLKENTTLLHYKYQLLNVVKEIIHVYSENYTKPINTLCGQHAELLTGKAVGAYSYHWA
jgi:hypothetical protein